MTVKSIWFWPAFACFAVIRITPFAAWAPCEVAEASLSTCQAARWLKK